MRSFTRAFVADILLLLLQEPQVRGVLSRCSSVLQITRLQDGRPHHAYVHNYGKEQQSGRRELTVSYTLHCLLHINNSTLA